MNPANIPANHWLTDYVARCGSKRSAAHALVIPRGTLRRWLKEIERTGVVHSSPKRVEALRNRLIERGRVVDTADALMGVFGYRRAGRGDDMTCASFPDSLADATGKGTGQKQGQDFLKTSDIVNDSAEMNGTKTGTKWEPAQLESPVQVKYRRSEFSTSGFSTTEGTNTETVQRLKRKTVHGSRIADGKARKRKTVLFLYDIHLPNQSAENIELALDYAQTRHEIDTVVLGGDFLDCAGISRWKKDPYGTMPLHEEIARGVAWLEMLRKRFPGSELVILKGNHEDRLQSYLWNQAAEISKLKGLKLQDQLELERLNIRWVDNLERVQRGEGVYRIGKLNILHGHELGICPNINPARQYFLRALDNMICGHVHKVDENFATTIAGKTLGAWVSGPLCDMHPEYRPINPWTAGFALAHFDDDGLFSVKLYKIIQGRVL